MSNDLMVSRVSVEIGLDAEDVVIGLSNNDDQVMVFVMQMLEYADSVELRERLAERLRTWDEDRAV